MSVYIAKSTAVAARMLDGEMMIMSARDSTLFTLNPMASVIWQAADGNTTLSEIVERKICTEFEVGRDEAMNDAEQFVNSLASHGILVVADSPISSAASNPVHGEAR
jgi:hypothetical protein